MSDIVGIASAEIGVHEASGHNDGVPAERYAGGRSEPWCAHFVAWCFRAAGRSLPGDTVPSAKAANPLASVKHMHRVVGEHDWLVMAPKAGDIVFFNSRGASDAQAGAWHVGIVQSVCKGHIHSIEGNWSDAVCVVRHMLDSPRIVGYGRPPE